MSFFRSSFIKLPKHRQFKYKPRHYDPDQEQERPSVMEGKRRMDFRKAAQIQKYSNQDASKSRRRILFLSALLLILVYLILR